jgi:dipeptide/tripeptide permease
MESVFWPTAFGAAIGVIAGVFVQFLCQWLLSKFADRNVKKTLKKEFQYNVLTLDAVALSLRQFRDAVNANGAGNAQTYVPCNAGLHMQSGNLASTGRLYDFFSAAQLKQLWDIQQLLSAATSQWYHSELEKRKQMLMGQHLPQDQVETLNFLNFADGQVAARKADLIALSNAF